jgi:hypothetical protein
VKRAFADVVRIIFHCNKFIPVKAWTQNCGKYKYKPN